MSWLETLAFVPRPPDSRPIREIEQEILDELEFHVEMRTLDNVGAGMSAAEARQDAIRRFGDFEQIRKACRQTLLGERIMLQRVQAVLTLVLLGAMVFMGVALYRGQQANEAATALMMQKNQAAAELMLQRLERFEKIATKPATVAADPGPSVVATVPKTGDRNVDPSLTEIRVTYNKEMMDHSWSWCYDPAGLKTTGKPHYEADGKTCVLPVKLEPGKTYTISLNTNDYRNFRDTTGQPAIPYLLQFATRQEATTDGGMKPKPSVPRAQDRPKVMSVSPAPNASGVDPVTEIRIRFDRPMDPNRMRINAGGPSNVGPPFRLGGSPTYVTDAKEFVVPVILKPSAKYEFNLAGLTGIDDKVCDFRSTDGVAAAAYSWKFATRDVPANPKAAKPRVVSVDPPSGAQTGMVTTIRVRFDQPMNPQAFDAVCSIPDEGMQLANPYVIVPVEYDAASRTFTFLTSLPRSTSPRIELRGFRGADGGEAETMTIDYEVGKRLYSSDQEARIVAAGHSPKLRELVEAIRRRRLALKSLEDTVRTLSLWPDRKGHLGWSYTLDVNHARFAFQGDRQFFADGSSELDISPGRTIPPFIFRLGSDGRECWLFTVGDYGEEKFRWKEVQFCPFNAMRDKTVVIGDPFGSKHFASTEKAIEQMKLEYLGESTCEGKTCHRLRSWAGSIFENQACAVQDWFIDAKTLLPAAYAGWNGRHEFSYAYINEPIPPETFCAPNLPGVQRKPYKLEEGYDTFHLRACDGSDGRMSVRWGQHGKKGGMGSGMN